MSNIGEQIQNRLLLSDKVVTSARTNATTVALALAKRAKEVEGPKTSLSASDFEAVLRFLAGGLEQSSNAMRQAEQTVAAEKADDLAIRTARDFNAAELHTLLARLRSAIDEHLGNDGLGRYGIEEDSPRTPRKLAEYTFNVVQLLHKYPIKVTSPFGSSLDTAAVIAVLEPKAKALETIVADDDREWRELEDAYAKRNRAIEVWNDAYQGTASALEGMYRFAGFGELAAKVRPTLRKARGDDPGPDVASEPAGGK